MRVTVECSCGWKRELSQFYAGKRIRCADCNSVLEVPGIGGGLYSSRKLERDLGRPTPKKGVWLPLSCRPGAHVPRSTSPRSCVSRSCGNSIFFVMIAVVVALNVGRILRDGREAQQREVTPMVETEDEAPAEKKAHPDRDVEREDEF